MMLSFSPLFIPNPRISIPVIVFKKITCTTALYIKNYIILKFEVYFQFLIIHESALNTLNDNALKGTLMQNVYLLFWAIIHTYEISSKLREGDSIILREIAYNQKELVHCTVTNIIGMKLCRILGPYLHHHGNRLH